MDLSDRVELAIRYWVLAGLSLFNMTEHRSFGKQLRRIEDIFDIYEDSEELRSEESETCRVAEGSFEDIGGGEHESSRSGKVLQEDERSGDSEEQSDGRTH